jgi:short subunit dehydrogenase-like uncharacterized protein
MAGSDVTAPRPATLGVLGASGYTGRLVVAEGVRRGHAVVALGRDPNRVRSRLEADGIDVDGDLAGVRTADVGDPDGLRASLAGLEVLLTTVGPFDQLGRDVLDAAIDTGTHYVDVTGEQPFIRWAYDERDTAARAAGISAVPAAGFDFLPGDLLAGVAGAAGAEPAEIHVAYIVPGSGGLLRVASAGTRRTAATMLDRPGVALDRGELIEERIAEARRLAWFPRPVGPHHAAGIPGGEAISVPRHVLGVRTVRTYLAMPGWQAEATQVLGAAARWGPLRRRLTAVLERGSGGPSEERRRTTRWGCVAEARGRDGVARAWAYGHDLYGLTATAMVVVGEALVEGGVGAGVVPPAAVGAPGEVLDRIAARSDLRWSVSRPDPLADDLPED